jgi:uncharacterized protein (TIGR00369 family)
VVLNGDSDQTISNDIVFYNLDIQTAGSLQANGDIVVLNNGIIGDSTSIDLGGNQLNVQGDLTDNGGNLAVATDKPFIVAASAATSTTVLVEFNEALNATANDAANYGLAPGISVTAAGVNGKLVTLTVSPAMTEREYTLTVNNVRNLNNTAINANHIKSVREGLVKGVAKPIHLGKTTQIWEIKIYNEAGQLSCISRITMAILDKK